MRLEQWIAPAITVVGVVAAAALARTRSPNAATIAVTEAEAERTLIGSMEAVVDALERRIVSLEAALVECETERTIDRKAIGRLTRALVTAGIPID